jgi:acetamidase/formamidase
MLSWLSARPATQGEISECDAHAAISDGIITGTGIECSMNVRARITLVKNRALERPIIAQGGGSFCRGRSECRRSDGGRFAPSR